MKIIELGDNYNNKYKKGIAILCNVCYVIGYNSVGSIIDWNTVVLMVSQQESHCQKCVHNALV